MSPHVTKGLRSEKAKRLLTEVPPIRSACALDLLLFLHRHPRTLLTVEHLAGFLGYDSTEIAEAIERFIQAGLLEGMGPQSMPAPRMFILLLDGPQGEGARKLLELASTRDGRLTILEAVTTRESHREQGGRGPDNSR